MKDKYEVWASWGMFDPEEALEAATRRRKGMPYSDLEIPGVSQKYIALLNENGYHYLDDIIEAGYDEIEAIDGIGPKTVAKIFEYIEGGDDD